MDITGNIIAALPLQSGTSPRTGSTWQRQDFVLEIPGAWPRHFVFTVFGEDKLKLMNIQPGEQNVTVQFEMDAHPYQDKWYNEVRAYNIIHHNTQQPQQPSAPAPQQQGDKTDDLPS